MRSLRINGRKFMGNKEERHITHRYTASPSFVRSHRNRINEIEERARELLRTFAQSLSAISSATTTGPSVRNQDQGTGEITKSGNPKKRNVLS